MESKFNLCNQDNDDKENLFITSNLEQNSYYNHKNQPFNNNDISAYINNNNNNNNTVIFNDSGIQPQQFMQQEFQQGNQKIKKGFLSDSIQLLDQYKALSQSYNFAQKKILELQENQTDRSCITKSLKKNEIIQQQKQDISSLKQENEELINYIKQLEDSFQNIKVVQQENQNLQQSIQEIQQQNQENESLWISKFQEQEQELHNQEKIIQKFHKYVANQTLVELIYKLLEIENTLQEWKKKGKEDGLQQEKEENDDDDDELSQLSQFDVLTDSRNQNIYFSLSQQQQLHQQKENNIQQNIKKLIEDQKQVEIMLKKESMAQQKQEQNIEKMTIQIKQLNQNLNNQKQQLELKDLSQKQVEKTNEILRREIDQMQDKFNKMVQTHRDQELKLVQEKQNLIRSNQNYQQQLQQKQNAGIYITRSARSNSHLINSKGNQQNWQAKYLQKEISTNIQNHNLNQINE